MIPKQIIRGTTPTFTIVFKIVDIADIADAYFGIRQAGALKVSKDFKEAIVDTENNVLLWTLTQAETMALIPDRKAIVSADWILSDGTRGRSREVVFDVEEPVKKKVV